jgi:hypothetical protein
MSSTDDIVNSFNIGFFSTNIDSIHHIDLNVPENSKYADFDLSLKEISKEALPPPPEEYIYLDGYSYDKNNNATPTMIKVKGHSQASFLDKYGNWDVEAEAAAYKTRELEYKKEVINEWLDNKDYDLQNKAALMKAILAKTENN